MHHFPTPGGVVLNKGDTHILLIPVSEWRFVAAELHTTNPLHRGR